MLSTICHNIITCRDSADQWELSNHFPADSKPIFSPHIHSFSKIKGNVVLQLLKILTSTLNYSVISKTKVRETLVTLYKAQPLFLLRLRIYRNALIPSLQLSSMHVLRKASHV